MKKFFTKKRILLLAIVIAIVGIASLLVFMTPSATATP